MGLFDKVFKGKEEQPKRIETKMPESPRPRIRGGEMQKLDKTEAGGKQLVIAEYYDDTKKLIKFYDTTKLIIDAKPLCVVGLPVYCAKVAWFSEDDCVYLGEDGKDTGRRNQFTEIKLEIDMDKLATDPEYQQVLMTDLLDQGRVKGILQMGMQEHPERPCGDYIGKVGIRSDTGKYGRIFDWTVGQAIHTSPEITAKREEYRQCQEKRRQEQIAKKKAEIAKLQKEIDEL